MACTIDKLSALDMAVNIVSDKAILGPLTPEEEQLFSDIKSLIASTMEHITLIDRLVTIKAALEES